MKSDADEARKTAVALMSAGVPSRCSGMRDADPLGPGSMMPFDIFVGNNPGAMALTVMPCGAHSSANCLVKAISPPLLVA